MIYIKDNVLLESDDAQIIKALGQIIGLTFLSIINTIFIDKPCEVTECPTKFSEYFVLTLYSDLVLIMKYYTYKTDPILNNKYLENRDLLWSWYLYLCWYWPGRQEWE